MKKLIFFLLLGISLFLISCGGNPEAEGDQAYANGKYSQALNYYLEVKKSQPQNAKVDEKIALCYMLRGLDLYKKRHNIKAFAGNFEKGQEFIPEKNLSGTFKKEYSKLLYELAVAYHQAKPSNEIQKEQYFTHTLDYLDEALAYDENNAQAEQTLQQIRKENFHQTFNKGMEFFKRAKKERNNSDLFLTAEYYLKRAVSFMPENKEAQKNLRLVRKKTLSVLDLNMDLPFAIADRQYSGKYLLLAFTALNNSGEPFTFEPAQIKVYTFDGKAVGIDADFTAKFKDGITNAVQLAPRKRLDGTLAFRIPKSVKIEYVGYELLLIHI